MKLKFETDTFRAQPDPFMCETKEGWVMYVTGTDGVGAYASDSPFGTWTYKGLIFQMDGCREYWAPCMICIDDWYYLYFSCSNDKMFEHLHVAKSKSPFGPFQDVKRLYPYFSIDPHVVQTKEGLFIWYCMNNMQCERVGTRIYVEKMLDPYTPDGHPVEVVCPSFDEEIFMRDRFEKGEDWHTIEGPFWLESEGYQYIMYSGACYQNDTYHIGYAVAKTDEQDLTKVKFEKHTYNGQFDPLMIKNEVEEGVGHHSVIKYDNQFYAVYHGRDVDIHEGNGDKRTARICKLHLEKELISVERK